MNDDKEEEPSARHVTIIGLDVAKRVFQVHGVDAAGRPIVRRKLQRSELYQPPVVMTRL